MKFLLYLFPFEATESDSKLLASDHSSSIAKRASKGKRQSKKSSQKKEDSFTVFIWFLKTI
ncbi:MAG TPA: hypothetical protein DEA43_01860 [Candidatus Moranbacteria bacterium]|nr:hypothetical protein [Candidatus Moranbacteria bacterium]HBT45614.1 hypothetical protein [Candidatus Moranbacteria bacterium]